MASEGTRHLLLMLPLCGVPLGGGGSGSVQSVDTVALARPHQLRREAVDLGCAACRCASLLLSQPLRLGRGRLPPLASGTAGFEQPVGDGSGTIWPLGRELPRPLVDRGLVW